MQHDFILLDRSGSMSSLWTEAISSINGYVKKLADDKVDTGVTLATFDTGPDGNMSFDILRDRITPPTWRDIAVAESSPRGMTPLNDATGRIVALADKGNYDKAAIIIMTDGQENHSKELTVTQARDLLDKCRSKGWQVIFLGADFDNARQAQDYGAKDQQIVSSSIKNLRATMDSLAQKRDLYGSGAAATMDFDETEKAELAKK